MPRKPGALADAPVVARLLTGLALAAAILLTSDYLVAKTFLGGSLFGVLQRLGDIVVLAGFLASAWVVGERGLDALGASLGPGRYRAALAVGLGLIPAYVVAMLLAVFQLVRPWTLGTAVVLPFLVWPGRLKRLPDTLRRLPPTRFASSPTTLLGLGLVALYAAAAMLPPCWDDPLTYHLTIPKEYLAHGGVLPDHGNFFHNFPMAMSMLYMYLMALGSDLLPKLLHGTFLVLIGVIVHEQLRVRFGARVARWSVLFFLGQWTVQHGVQRANVDFYFAFYGLAAFFLVLRSWAPAPELDGVGRWPILLGLFLGAAISGKVHALVCVAATAALLGLLLVRRLVGWRPIATAACLAVLVYAPTLLRNLVTSTDPYLFMAADQMGLNLPAPPEVAARLHALAEIKPLFMTRPDLLNFLLVPYLVYRDGSFPTTTFDAVIDPLYLLGVPLAFLLRRREPFVQAVLVYLGAFYVAWMVTTPLTRYAMPVLPLLAFLTVGGLDAVSAFPASRAPKAIRSGLFACLGTIVAVNLVGMVLSVGHLVPSGMAATLGLTERARFLSLTGAGSMIDVSRHIAQVEEEKGLPRMGVFMVFASQTYYLDHPYVNDPFYVNLSVLRAGAREGRDPLRELRRRGFGWVLVEAGRLPWLVGGRHGNPQLNPYPEGLEVLRGYLEFWRSTLEPRLEVSGTFGGYRLYRIPESPRPAS